MGRILVALLLIGTVAAQPTEPGIYNPEESTESTMYFHINGFQQFPINTQKPDDRYAETVGRGLPENSGCVEDPAGAQHFTDKAVHTWYGYSSPSIVEYNNDDNGKPVIHQERGLAYDVELDQSAPTTFSWFLEGVSPLPMDTDLDEDQAPGIVPNAIVRATIREGDEVSVGDEAFNQGKLIAIGESQPTHLAGPMTEENEDVKVHEVNGHYIYEFTFPLEVQEDTITRDEGYNIRVDAFIDNPYCSDPTQEQSAFLDYARVHTSSEFRPKLVWSIFNPLYIEVMHPQFVGDDLVVHTQINSPWGSYDVLGDLPHEQELGFNIDGPSQVLTLDKIIVQHTTGHGPEQHFKPVQATWLWDYQADSAKDGTYTVVLHAQNDQQTAEAWAMSTFEIGGENKVCYTDHDGNEVCDVQVTKQDDQKSPGLPLAALIIGLAVLVRRR